jgi:hypothetical protein
MLLNIWNYGGGLGLYVAICWYISSGKFATFVHRKVWEKNARGDN